MATGSFCKQPGPPTSWPPLCNPGAHGHPRHPRPMSRRPSRSILCGRRKASSAPGHRGPGVTAPSAKSTPSKRMYTLSRAGLRRLAPPHSEHLQGSTPRTAGDQQATDGPTELRGTATTTAADATGMHQTAPRKARAGRDQGRGRNHRGGGRRMLQVQGLHIDGEATHSQWRLVRGRRAGSMKPLGKT